MIQTKLITDTNSADLENNLNLFIASKITANEQLIDIKFTESKTNWSALIIYKDK